MATFVELSDPYANFMQNPARPGPGICTYCRGFPNAGYAEDRGCGFNPKYIDALACISYASKYGQLYTALSGYKENASEAVRRRFTRDLASVLWRFLLAHEACVAAAAGTEGFDVIACVPSKTVTNDGVRPHLRNLVGHTCGYTAPRFERVVIPTGDTSIGRSFDAGRYRCTRRLDGADVLLIDDTWVTGSNAQSAACALKAAGADRIGCVAIGRYVVPDYEDHGERLAALPRGFSWRTCALHP